VKYGVSPLDYAKRARSLSKLGDHASLVYASLELRCGIESRLQQHASVAVGVSKGQASAWEITKGASKNLVPPTLGKITAS
jgi:hypothetical protein